HRSDTESRTIPATVVPSMKGGILASFAACAFLMTLMAASAQEGASGPGARPAHPVPVDEEEQIVMREAMDQAHPLSSGALCGRANHDLEDGSRVALLRSRFLFSAAVKYYPEAACGHAGLARALTAILA